MGKAIPVLRIFDYNKAIEFYINWLKFKIDWEHKPEATPIYMQISYKGDLVLHLTEHHGDCCPGSKVYIQDFKGLKEYHQSLLDQGYKYNKPGLEVPFYNEKAIEMQVTDPFGNNLLFSQDLSDQSAL
ncbi:unnamed protein product [Cunninghamella blakesleeana]